MFDMPTLRRETSLECLIWGSRGVCQAVAFHRKTQKMGWSGHGHVVESLSLLLENTSLSASAWGAAQRIQKELEIVLSVPVVPTAVENECCGVGLSLNRVYGTGSDADFGLIEGICVEILMAGSNL